MSLDRTRIDQIAHLARLALDPGDLPGFERDLSQILALVETMNQVDTDGVEPLAHPLEISARLRPDQVTEADQRDRFQSIAPAVAEGYYLVPKVIE